jgi:hypothetical protein
MSVGRNQYIESSKNPEEARSVCWTNGLENCHKAVHPNNLKHLNEKKTQINRVRFELMVIKKGMGSQERTKTGQKKHLKGAAHELFLIFFKRKHK